jgi:hypothetical protein
VRLGDFQQKHQSTHPREVGLGNILCSTSLDKRVPSPTYYACLQFARMCLRISHDIRNEEQS